MMTTLRSFAMPFYGVVSCALLIHCAPPDPALESITSSNGTKPYVVRNVHSSQARTMIAATGASIFEVGHDYVLIDATSENEQQLSNLGLSIEPADDMLRPQSLPGPGSDYHSYDEMV